MNNQNIAKIAEEIIQVRGISHPEDIDLKAIAKTLFADIEELPLVGCEARIIGNNKTATISINSNSIYERKRFSLGHELGHWQLHKGINFSCRDEDIGNSFNNSKSKEREADEFSANLLMPGFIFNPFAKTFRHIDFESIEKLAKKFKTSFLATAIRFIDSNTVPAMIICHDRRKRVWFKASSDIPSRWFPQDTLDEYSFAYDILFKGEIKIEKQQTVSASSWFDCKGGTEYEILEQSKPYGKDRVLTILEFRDVDMLSEYPEREKDLYRMRWK
jgi:hypothetical protein